MESFPSFPALRLGDFAFQLSGVSLVPEDRVNRGQFVVVEFEL